MLIIMNASCVAFIQKFYVDLHPSHPLPRNISAIRRRRRPRRQRAAACAELVFINGELQLILPSFMITGTMMDQNKLHLIGIYFQRTDVKAAHFDVHNKRLDPIYRIGTTRAVTVIA